MPKRTHYGATSTAPRLWGLLVLGALGVLLVVLFLGWLNNWGSPGGWRTRAPGDLPAHPQAP